MSVRTNVVLSYIRRNVTLDRVRAAERFLSGWWISVDLAEFEGNISMRC